MDIRESREAVERARPALIHSRKKQNAILSEDEETSVSEEEEVLSEGLYEEEIIPSTDEEVYSAPE